MQWNEIGIPMVMQNLRAARGWRPRDMVNWHRMVRPIAQLPRRDPGFDVYQLLFDICARMAVQYVPCHADGSPPPIASEDPAAVAASYVRGEPRIGLFVDSTEHLSGVSATISEWVLAARKRSLELRVHTAATSCGVPGSACFPPMGTLNFSSYPGLDLHVPVVSDVMDYIKSQSFDVIHISTPGPMGLLGLLAAHTLRVPVCGTYHTDFPRYAAQLTGDPALADVAWAYMRWFYGCMDRVAAPSSSTRTELIRHGLDERVISIVGRGVDLAAFSPAHRDDALRASWGPARHKLLYVGRISAEKNVHCLAEAFKLLVALRDDVELIVAGDGPARGDLQRELAGLPVRFTGMKKGRDLAAIYASCDLFLFPSETDTFGRVVLEAQASGLPVIVSSAGGPKDAVAHGTSGVVIECIAPDKLCSTVCDLLDYPIRCHAMRLAAREQARLHTPDASFDAFWAMNRGSISATWPGTSAPAAT